MIPRTSAYIPTDMLKDPFYNEAKYVGKGGYYKGNGNYQCVNYAIGRSCEIAGKAVCYYSGISTKAQIEKPMMNRSGYGNACSWMSDTLWQKGTVPKVGAVMVYGAGYGGGYGHVRVVEQIEDGRIFYSAANESRRLAFKWIDAPKVTQNGFLGYIYNPYVQEYDQLISENATLKAELSRITAEKQQAEELLAKADKALQTAQNKLERIKELL